MSTRQEALATLEAGDAALHALVGRLSDDALARPATIGDTGWAAKDLLGHIAFWEELAASALARWRAGLPPLRDGSADTLNADNHERTAGQSVKEVRKRAAAAHRTITSALRAMSDEEWSSPPFYAEPRHASLGEMLGSLLGGPSGPCRHAIEHLPDLRAYVESVS